MVESLHLVGLRVVMDVVYNHTATVGQDPCSVLDKVVPGYYYRLDRNGDCYTSTCCPNTASEHRMFFKLMLDTLKVWVKQYRVDGFRFDLMGFSFKNNLLEIKKTLQEIDPTLSWEQLDSLGDKLTLPQGWSYSSRPLTADLVLGNGGTAYLVHDNLDNTYQKNTTGSSS